MKATPGWESVSDRIGIQTSFHCARSTDLCQLFQFVLICNSLIVFKPKNNVWVTRLDISDEHVKTNERFSMLSVVLRNKIASLKGFEHVTFQTYVEAL